MSTLFSSTEISTIAPEFIRSIAHAPDSIADPWAIAVGGAAMVVYAAYEWYSYDPAKPEGLSHDASNPGLVRLAVKDMKTGEDSNSVVYDRFYRMGRPIAIGVAAIALATTALAGVSYTAEQVHGQANIVTDLQTSNSTVDTMDGPHHESRFKAAKQAIINSGYSGNMAVYQFGNNNNVSVPLEKFNRKSLEANVTPSQVDINGANLVSSMQKASEILPNHTGEEIVITDGLIEDKASAVDAQVAAQKAEGIETKIIVIGTKGSNYYVNIGASPTPSSPNTQVFDGLPEGDVIKVSNPNQIETIIGKTVKSADSSPVQKPYFPAYLPGIVLGLFGFLGLRKQHKRKII